MLCVPTSAGKYADLNSMVISYGPCQTPTLGFCVERHDQIQQFTPESFWTVVPLLKKDGREVRPEWARGRVFDRKVGTTFQHLVAETGPALVTHVVRKEGKRPRPAGLNTVEMLRMASSFLRMGPHHAMQVSLGSLSLCLSLFSLGLFFRSLSRPLTCFLGRCLSLSLALCLSLLHTHSLCCVCGSLSLHLSQSLPLALSKLLSIYCRSHRHHVSLRVGVSWPSGYTSPVTSPTPARRAPTTLITSTWWAHCALNAATRSGATTSTHC